jgi:hypothetical protein
MTCDHLSLAPWLWNINAEGESIIETPGEVIGGRKEAFLRGLS